MKKLVARLAGYATLAVLWLLHGLPLSWQAALGHAVGGLLWRFARSRRAVTLRNLALCFPEWPEVQRERLGREVFTWFSRSVLERGVLWFAPVSRLRRLIQVEGDWGFADRHPGPVMWLVPLFARAETARPLMRAVRDGMGFFNLPDMDFGERDAHFVPFFGVPAATLLAPSRMARTLGMVVQPVLVRLLPGGEGYRVRYLPPLENFPTDDPVADATRMNRCIEDWVRECPEQYFWVHRRFKTRPPGSPSVY
jgi:KDO2-lipid IV(A) lauroyltransferase